MPTYNGWDVITMPATPAAPASFELQLIDVVAITRSPFTGEQQVQDWDASWREARVTLPPMPNAVAQAWLTFLENLKGVRNVFQFTASFQAAYPEIGARYWRLAQNSRGWSVSEARVYGVQFNILEAL